MYLLDYTFLFLKPFFYFLSGVVYAFFRIPAAAPFLVSPKRRCPRPFLRKKERAKKQPPFLGTKAINPKPKP